MPRYSPPLAYWYIRERKRRWANRPVLASYDLTSSSTGLTVVRNSVGYIDNIAGTWSSVAVDTLRRSNKGALIEPAATNGVRNNSGQGGASGSPGTLPTNWSAALRGTTRQVTAIGTSLGIDYVGVKLSGTTSSATAMSVNYDTATGISASAGQVRTFTVFLALAAGALTNITSIKLAVSESTAGGVFIQTQVSSVDIKASLTSTLQRFTFTYTTSGTTGAVQPYVEILQSGSGVAVDLTLWHGWPQAEAGALASSPIRTTSAAVTRAADQVSLTLPSGTTGVRSTFDDGSKQVVSAVPGSYTIPTNLDRAHIALLEVLGS